MAGMDDDFLKLVGNKSSLLGLGDLLPIGFCIPLISSILQAFAAPLDAQPLTLRIHFLKTR